MLPFFNNISRLERDIEEDRDTQIRISLVVPYLDIVSSKILGIQAASGYLALIAMLLERKL